LRKITIPFRKRQGNFQSYPVANIIYLLIVTAVKKMLSFFIPRLKVKSSFIFSITRAGIAGSLPTLEKLNPVAHSFCFLSLQEFGVQKYRGCANKTDVVISNLSHLCN